MMVKPTVTELLEKIDDNRYSLIIMSAKRARQISDGAQVLTKADDRSPVTLAATEIAEGKVKIISEEENFEETSEESNGSEEVPEESEEDKE